MRPHDGRAVPTFLRQALTDRPLTVFGDGSQTRSFCYVDDLIRGIVLLAESDIHEPINIGNPDEMSLLELAKTIIELTESHRRSCSRRCCSTTHRCASPTSRARDLLGWEPEIEFREGLRRTIEHLQSVLRQAGGAMSSAESNLEAIYKAIDHHNTACEWPAVAIEMNRSRSSGSAGTRSAGCLFAPIRTWAPARSEWCARVSR